MKSSRTTANGLLLKQANAILREDIIRMLEVLKKRAYEFKDTPCIGRTHGIHADITSFGLKWALWYEEMQRNLKRFEFAASGVEAGKISGAVGNYANIPPFIQDYVCEKLGIESAKISTQVLQRDRHAFYLSTLSLIASTMEQIATEVRGLQRTEVREAEEFFGKGQKGSSAMPHKRNPISSENICGCAHVMRGYMLCRFTGILENLVAFPENMKANIFKTDGVIFAQRVMNAMIDKGLSRETAYDTVQPLAMKAWSAYVPFKGVLEQSEDVSKLLSHEEIDSCFTMEYHFKNVQFIFDRVFGAR